MKRIGKLWDRIVAYDNLLLAYRKARKGKRSRKDVARFDLNLEQSYAGAVAEIRNNVVLSAYRHCLSAS